MEITVEPYVLSAERVSNGVFIEFGNGTCAMYSANVLIACLPQAERFIEPEVED